MRGSTTPSRSCCRPPSPAGPTTAGSAATSSQVGDILTVSQVQCPPTRRGGHERVPRAEHLGGGARGQEAEHVGLRQQQHQPGRPRLLQHGRRAGGHHYKVSQKTKETKTTYSKCCATAQALDADIPLMFISFPSAKDPEWSNHPGDLLFTVNPTCAVQC